MCTPFLREFREDVVQAALEHDPEIAVGQVAKDFGNHVGTLDTWMRQACTEVGDQPNATRSDSDELKELRKRKRLLKQGNEVLRRAGAYLS